MRRFSGLQHCLFHKHERVSSGKDASAATDAAQLSRLFSISSARTWDAVTEAVMLRFDLHWVQAAVHDERTHAAHKLPRLLQLQGLAQAGRHCLPQALLL